MNGFDPRVIRAAYEVAADDYLTTFGDDLDQLPLDRSLLDRVAERCVESGWVLDVGCGPAHVCRYLAQRRVTVIGCDFAPAMLAVARRRDPNLLVLGADIRALPVQTGAAAGIVSFYVLQHLRRSDLRTVLQELGRVLQPRGVLLLGVHAGEGEFHPTPEITATRYTADELAEHLTAASFIVETVDHRRPLPHEHQGDRVYVMASRA